MIKKSKKEYNKKEYNKELYLKNREKRLKQMKEHYLKNKEYMKEQQKEYRLKNKEYLKEQQKEYRLKNKERINERHKEHYLKNKEHIKEQQKEYLSRPKTQELRRNNFTNRYKTNVNFRILSICRARLHIALKSFNKSASTMELVGCTTNELRQHIESKFEPWMNWENQGLGGWDIDHIKACFHFNMEDPEQQRACFHWSNLQPMEHIANIKKGTR